MPDLLRGRYEIIKQLSDAGGFGETLLAIDRNWPSQRQCVIKRFRPKRRLDDDTYQIVRERFEREAAILGTLAETCQQVPKFYDYFSDGKDYYIVQEFIEGRTLSQIVRREGPLPEAAVKPLLVSLLETLGEIHAQNIIHRDIKPDNIILRQETNLPVLIDFGAVKEVVTTVVDKFGTPQRSSLVIGTPGYAPAEQVAGRPVFASDLYSLALTVIYALTGVDPLHHQTDPANGAMQWHNHADDISTELARCLDKAIALNYFERYPNAQAMLKAVAVPTEPPSSPPPPHPVIAQTASLNETPLAASPRPQPKPVKAPISGRNVKLAAAAFATLTTAGVGYWLYTLPPAVQPIFVPSPTVEPTVKRPRPSPTAKPTATPKPTVTPKPTPSPTPKMTPTPKPTPKTTPTPAVSERLRRESAAALAEANRLYGLGQYADALRKCNLALQHDPDNTEARRLKPKLEEANRLYPQPSSEQRRQQAAAKVSQANRLFAQDDLDGALRECNLALQFDPNSQEALKLKERIEKARKIFPKQDE